MICWVYNEYIIIMVLSLIVDLVLCQEEYRVFILGIIFEMKESAWGFSSIYLLERLQMGGYFLKNHMFTIEMGGYDIILVVEWLQTLGSITMDS